MKIEIGWIIREIEEARHYAGQISITAGIFEFDLQLAGPLSQLSKRHPITDFDGERLVYQLSLKKDGQEINLSGEEFYFFLSFIMEFTLGCYLKGLCDRVEKLFHGKITGFIPQDNGQESDSAQHGDDTQSDIYEITPALCAMLNDPKFDCKIVA